MTWGIMRARLLRASAMVSVLLAVSGCSALGSGPLEVGSLDICALATPGETLYFGVILDNAGTDEATVFDAHASGLSNVAAVEFLVDPHASEYDQVVGTMSWPTDEGFGGEQQVLDRAVEPEGAVVAPGEVGQLLVTMVPEDPSAASRIDAVAVTYETEGHVHTSRSAMRMMREPGPECALD